jgi:predicted phage terminase large subunit-like protein
MLDTLDPAAVTTLPPKMKTFIDWQERWSRTARPNQIPKRDFSEHGFMAGRGFGKTRIGAEWLGAKACSVRNTYCAVIAPTYADVAKVCFEGESGLLKVIPKSLIKRYNSSDLILELKSGTMIRGFTSEKPARLRGPQHEFIWCFIAGTLVRTPSGDVPIETLRPGDVVTTRRGPRAVLANSRRDNQPVGEVTFDNGAKLVGTADHPVYLKSGWTRMDQLQIGDTACAISVLSGAASGGTNTAAGITSGPTSLLNLSARFAYTAKSGLMHMARYLRGTTSITPMATRATTVWATLSAYLTEHIRLTILPTSQSLAATGPQGLTSRWPASTASANLSANGPQPTRAAASALRSQVTTSGKLSVYASVAAPSSSPAPETSVASVASTWQPQGQQSVYCLKVDGEPEYFANGILVHNCDELAAWQNAEETWDMAMMGLRLGKAPQVVWTTTPRPVELVRKLIVPKAGRVVVNGSTFDNRDNLPDRFFEQLEQYEGTTIGRQEIYGEMIDPEEQGVIKRSWLKLWPAKKPLPAFDWIIMSLDTAFTEATRDRKSGDADYTACSVWGVFQHEEKGYTILLDCWQEQLGMPDLIKRVKKEMNTAYGDDQDVAMIKPMYGSAKPMTSGRKPDILLIEDKGSGISLRQMLEREGILAHAYNPGRADKLARLHAVSPVFARRRVFLPESEKFPNKARVWADPLVAQLCSFTGKGSIKHDDFVDSSTQAMRLMMDKGMLGSLTEKKKQDIDRPPPKVVQNPYGQ